MEVIALPFPEVSSRDPVTYCYGSAYIPDTKYAPVSCTISFPYDVIRYIPGGFFGESLLTAVMGILVGLVSLHLMNLLARLAGGLAVLMLGNSHVRDSETSEKRYDFGYVR